MTNDVETIHFPEPRRRRPRIRYARAKSPHAHWAWIVPLYLGLVLVGTVVLLRAPAFLFPFCGIAGAVVFFTVLYGVIRSATR